MCNNFVTVFKTYTEHRIRKRFGDNAFELNEFLFIGHSLPDDQIGKAQIIVNLFKKNKIDIFL
ncbi:Uncharacterised protein [Acinetobacter baumannii]|nr:Uncharacterised protein [Acinetobacter baumannii]